LPQVSSSSGPFLRPTPLQLTLPRIT
jgi:hypothetical protein